MHVAVWVQHLQRHYETTSVKQQLAGLRMLFDNLVSGGVLAANPAAAVRGLPDEHLRHASVRVNEIWRRTRRPGAVGIEELWRGSAPTWMGTPGRKIFKPGERLCARAAEVLGERHTNEHPVGRGRRRRVVQGGPFGGLTLPSQAGHWRSIDRCYRGPMGGYAM